MPESQTWRLELMLCPLTSGFFMSYDFYPSKSAYRKELQSVMGEKNNVTLPQVFIKGKYIGGAEVIKQLNEIGELPKLLRGIPLRPIGYICEGCGDVRFLPCSNCDGSRKFFDEDEGQVRRCQLCNENGLVRCSLCCS
uniref:Uncharacterized protein At5g39865-like n=1 Tax=Nicotiana tabacum TaxID=4097 RepID=A0A1S3XP09_TOBAC|nr:PREDICTED: uncharacterized protein At5g39865-like [Nicotiana tabacum]